MSSPADDSRLPALALSPLSDLAETRDATRQRASLEEAPFWKEVAAFNQMPQSQIDQHYGKYVAVYEGNIVDADFDEAELALRFYRTFGYVPVYIHKVGTEEGLVDTDEV